MKENNFKSEVKEHFLNKNLSSSQLAALDKLQTDQDKSLSHKLSWNMAISFAIGVAVCLLFTLNVDHEKILIQKITREVAYNHRKQMPVEFKDESFKELNASLTKLDFRLFKPKYLTGFKVEGARYCSVQGKIAAQIKLVSLNNKYYTLYVYKNKSNFDQVLRKETDNSLKGPVLVKLWQENGLHFALAESI